MVEILKRFGFTQSESPEVWTKDLWTIRFFENLVEFYDADKSEGGSGKYFIGDVAIIDLEAILEDICETTLEII